MNNKHIVEKAILLNQPIDKDINNQLSIKLQQDVENILQGQYVQLLERSPLFNNASLSPFSIKEHQLDQWIKETVLSLLKKNNNEEDIIYTLFLTGIACLNLFIQLNWTGPLVDKTVLSLFNMNQEEEEEFHLHCLNILTTDGEQAYHLSSQLGYLIISKTILFTLYQQFTKKENDEDDLLLTISFWTRRAIFIHQQLLDECTATLQDLLINELTPISAKQMKIQQDDTLKLRHELETGLIYSYFHQDKEAFDQLKEAQLTSGFEWSITGALGKRTKFQQYDISQLVVLAESKKKDDHQEEEKQQLQPEEIDLDDDTLLEKISFSNTKENERDAMKRHGNLDVMDQCLLLGFCLNIKNTNPEHGMTYEQMVPFVTRVLENANNWMVHTMGLLLKSRLESHRTRTMNRAALQLQALVDQIKLDHQDDDDDEIADAKDRLTYIYDLLLPSKWSMERELGLRFMGLGVIRSALDIFERLEMWEDVVSCHQMLDQKQKAKELVETLLKDQPDSPKLWCILGDIDEDPQYWLKAWEISHYRYARAMRSLGAHFYRKEEYQKSIDYYQKALEINPLFISSWFVMGCSGMMIDDWETSSRAFQRVVGLEQDNAEAWNNLASIYLKMKDKKIDAFLALKQACKLKYDNWKMWQNLLYVSMDVGQFADAIWAMQRVIDLTWDKLREQSVDLQVLQLLVDGVIQNKKDLHQQELRNLSIHVEKLLENVILTRITNSPDIWRICGKFYLYQERYKDALDSSLKAYRTVMHNPRLETDLDTFNDVTGWCLDLVDMYETLGEKQDVLTQELVCKDWKYQSKLVLKSLMGKVKDTFDDTPSYDSLKERLDDLKQQ